jgi:putative tryptophan/tyrosine transport system substrate-binding protein
MKRRSFITLLGGAAAWPLVARAQQDQRVRRIGVLMGDFPENNPEARAAVAAFREELQKLEWTEGRNIQIDTRWAAADIEAMQRFAKELVGSQPELIFSTNTPPLRHCCNKRAPSRSCSFRLQIRLAAASWLAVRARAAM